MWSFARNVRYEHETSLAFSLPVDVGQGDLLLRFWQWPGSLESFVYRKTRYGAFSWRVGTNVSLARRHRRDDDDRLTIVRALIGATPPRLKDGDGDGGGGGGIVSQLKASLATDRTLRYEDTISLRANIRYPLVMEDRQSIELWPLPLDLERELIECEDDTSDNNLGITFDHRLSLRANVCERCSLVMIPAHSDYDDGDISYCHSPQCSLLSMATTMTDTATTTAAAAAAAAYRPPSVRVSLRASLNEYHEASYHFEMECEEENEEDSVERRRARHDAIATVFRDVALPMLTVHWPDGLMRECVPYTPEPTTLTACRTPIRMTSGRSYFTRERLFATLSSVSGDSVTARLKYDGEQTFGWYAMGEFWVDSEANTIDSITRDLLCGLYIYQLERERYEDAAVLVDDYDRQRPSSSKQPTRADRRRAAVITEVAFFISHRHVVTMNGGGALPRQIEVPENAYSIEQRTPETAYILASPTTTDVMTTAAPSASFWVDLLSLLLPQLPPPSPSSSRPQSTTNMRHRYITTCFFHTCSKWPVSYVAAATATAASNPNAAAPPLSHPASVKTLKAPSTSMRYRLSLSKLTRDLFAKRRQQHHRRRLDDDDDDDDDIMHSWLSVDCCANDNYGGLLERALIPLTLEYSLHFLRRMHEAIVTAGGGRRHDSITSPQISVSRTYALPTELAQLRDHYHRASTAVSTVGNTDRPFKLDGVLLVRRDRYDRDDAAGGTLSYEKWKLYQTVEVFVKRDPLALCSRDRGTFATFHSIVSFEMSLWRRCAAGDVDTDSEISDGRFLLISDLPIPVVNNGRIAELEFRGARSRRRHNYDNERRRNYQQRQRIILRFVRWRDDKEHCDKFVKIANILRNR